MATHEHAGRPVNINVHDWRESFFEGRKAGSNHPSVRTVSNFANLHDAALIIVHIAGLRFPRLWYLECIACKFRFGITIHGNEFAGEERRTISARAVHQSGRVLLAVLVDNCATFDAPRFEDFLVKHAGSIPKECSL